jgi:uncharacterized protein
MRIAERGARRTPAKGGAPVVLGKADARRCWLHAQRLDTREPFGAGAQATRAAVEHLGYVQIDTINVIERCHHHILWTRIPDYERGHLHQAQTVDKSVFEYWTHALSYVPTRDLRFFLPTMRRQRQAPRRPWNQTVTDEDLRKVLTLIRRDGSLTIRDFKDDDVVEKYGAWGSRKPSKGALEMQFVRGVVTVSERTGMVKTYELMGRHFGWERPPRPATERQVLAYQLDRALRSQGLVSLDSTCYHAPKLKPPMRELIESRVRRKQLVPVTIDGARKVEHWAEPRTLDVAPVAPSAELVHILSPFDPLVIQRKRLALFFDYDHVFEAYVPKDKRVYGYFTLPVLVGDEVVAGLDLKTDRDKGALLVQRWNWVGRGTPRRHGAAIEKELDRFERFQLQP